MIDATLLASKAAPTQHHHQQQEQQQEQEQEQQEEAWEERQSIPWPEIDGDATTWTQGRVAEMRPFYPTPQPHDRLDDSEDEEEMEMEMGEDQHLSFALLGDSRNLGLSPIPWHRRRWQRLPAMPALPALPRVRVTFPTMERPQWLLHAPAAMSVARSLRHHRFSSHEAGIAGMVVR
jgi:hypothetical protein